MGVYYTVYFREVMTVSAGSKIVPVRIPPELLRRIEIQILQRNIHTAEEPWVMSDFIKISIERNLRKMERSRKKPGKGRATK